MLIVPRDCLVVTPPVQSEIATLRNGGIVVLLCLSLPTQSQYQQHRLTHFPRNDMKTSHRLTHYTRNSARSAPVKSKISTSLLLCYVFQSLALLQVFSDFTSAHALFNSERYISYSSNFLFD